MVEVELFPRYWIGRTTSVYGLPYYLGVPVSMQLERYIDIGTQISFDLPQIGLGPVYPRSERAGEPRLLVWRARLFGTVIAEGYVINRARLPGIYRYEGMDVQALLSMSVTGEAQTYAGAAHTIVTQIVNEARTTMFPESRNPLGRVSVSVISAATESATYPSSFQPRLDTIRDVLAICNDQLATADSNERYYLQASSVDTLEFRKTANTASVWSEASTAMLVLGERSIRDYELLLYEEPASIVKAVGIARGSLNVFFSRAADPSSAFALETMRLYSEIQDQTNLNALARNESRRLTTRYSRLLMTLSISPLQFPIPSPQRLIGEPVHINLPDILGSEDELDTLVRRCAGFGVSVDRGAASFRLYAIPVSA